MKTSKMYIVFSILKLKRMCRSKMVGGMGFKDMAHFKDGDLCIARTFWPTRCCSQYFPRSSLLDVRLGRYISFINLAEYMDS